MQDRKSPPFRLLDGVAERLSLSDDARSWLLTVCKAHKRIDSAVDLVVQGEEPGFVHLLQSGLAVRYRTDVDGQVQNFAFIIPGNFCESHTALLDYSDHSIKTLSPCQIVAIPRQAVLDAAKSFSSLMRAFWWCALVNEALLRQWIVNLGRKSADRRIAHLFCEMHARLQSIGHVQPDNSFWFPVTQQELGRSVGLSNVHVNRSLQALRQANLIRFDRSRVMIPDVAQLQLHAAFDPDYLYLNSRLDQPPLPSRA